MANIYLRKKFEKLNSFYHTFINLSLKKKYNFFYYQ
jgi:hypothetical protein